MERRITESDKEYIYTGTKWLESHRVPFIGFSAGVLATITEPFSYLIKRCLEITDDDDAIIFMIAMILPLILCLVEFAMMAVVLILYFAVIDVIYLIILGIVKVMDKVSYRRHTRFYVCPDCGKQYQKSLYDLPPLEIEGLKPSRYGIFRTEVDRTIYPASNLFRGRSLLTQICPNPDCKSHYELHEGKPLVITMAGGRNSGKTSFACAVLANMADSEANGHSDAGGFFSQDHVDMVTDHVHGRNTPTTEDFLPPYVYAFTSSRMKTGRLLYMYDVSGNFFTARGSTQEVQIQYPYNDGIVFMVDPSDPDAANTAFNMYNGFVVKYREVCKYKVSKKIDVPLAIVLSHADDSRFNFIGKDSKDIRSEMGALGFSDIILTAEHDFSTVAFFSCTTIGNDNSVEAPMKWIASKSVTDYKQYF